jgi:hypothetical protein
VLYSERLFRGESPTGNYFYTIPAGKRAVVRVIELRNGATAVANVVVGFNGTYCYQVSLPASGGSLHIDTRQVLYAGEQLAMSVNGAATAWYISGYLFDDTHPRAETLPGPVEWPDPWKYVDDPVLDPRGVGRPRSLNRPGRRPVDQEAAGARRAPPGALRGPEGRRTA